MTADLPIDALVLVNSASSGYLDGQNYVLPYLDHFGLPYLTVNLLHTPLPQDVANYPLIIIAHHELDPRDTVLGSRDRQALINAVAAGSGLVSFDPYFTPLSTPGPTIKAPRLEFAACPHYIVARHAPGEIVDLVEPMTMATFSQPHDSVLISVDDWPLLSVSTLGRGRVVQWATNAWMRSSILGPLAGLDDVVWRGLVWAARKPFVLRGLPPLVAMRVDDVAGWGELYEQSPLYWVRVANRYGFKPWLGLFISNFTDLAVTELRGLIQQGQATAFPHAFGRPPRSPEDSFPYYANMLSHRAPDGDEFIYFDHVRRRPWSDDEALRRLIAVDQWYGRHAPLPMSTYMVAHWTEIGHNVVGYIQDRWGIEFVGAIMDVNLPFAGSSSWLMAGPFRRYEAAGTAAHDPALRGQRSVYYADFVNLGGRQFFDCVTEIRDVVGYEWAPDNDPTGTIDRAVRQLRRALDSMALAVLFTHETDYIYRILPEVWEQELARITEEIAEYQPIYVTLDEGVQYVRASRTAKLQSGRYNPSTGEVMAVFTGYADVPTQFFLFTASGEEINITSETVPPFIGEAAITVKLPRV